MSQFLQQSEKKLKLLSSQKPNLLIFQILNTEEGEYFDVSDTESPEIQKQQNNFGSWHFLKL